MTRVRNSKGLEIERYILTTIHTYLMSVVNNPSEVYDVHAD